MGRQCLEMGTLRDKHQGKFHPRAWLRGCVSPSQEAFKRDFKNAIISHCIFLTAYSYLHLYFFSLIHIILHTAYENLKFMNRSHYIII